MSDKIYEFLITMLAIYFWWKNGIAQHEIDSLRRKLFKLNKGDELCSNTK